MTANVLNWGETRKSYIETGSWVHIYMLRITESKQVIQKGFEASRSAFRNLVLFLSARRRQEAVSQAAGRRDFELVCDTRVNTHSHTSTETQNAASESSVSSNAPAAAQARTQRRETGVCCHISSRV